MKHINFQNKYKYLIIISVIFSSLILQSLNNGVHSQSSEEIAKEIEKKKNELDKTKGEINDLVSKIEGSKKELENVEVGLPRLYAQIDEIESQIELNKKNLEYLQSENELKQLEKVQRETNQKKSLKSTYKEWRGNQNIYVDLLKENSDDDKARRYGKEVFGKELTEVSDLQTEIDSLDGEISDLATSLDKLNNQNVELEKKKQEIESQIAYYNSLINNNSSQIGRLQDQQSQIVSQINDLTIEQKVVAEREAWILQQQQNQNNQNNNGGQNNANLSNPFVFSGKGRDLYQGHGVGMSQWGAYGMAENGFSYDKIIKFYYTGVEVVSGYETTTLSVQGYGGINIEDYLAGQGEVPSRACGNAQQAEENPQKYVLDNTSTPWDCWPEEAIKAQIIAFRSYAIDYANTIGQICTTAACQVYNGSQSTRWAAEETKGMVATYNGKVIQALYSSDNSQGNGTANNDTIFQNLAGNGTPIGYLRAVNDTAYARQTQWTNWTYSTNQYDYNSIDQLLNYAASSTTSGYSSSVKGEFQAIISDIGKVSDISFERDPSLRVKKVILTGTTGKQRTIGGWWFKNLWNSWIYDTGKSDYIYSQTFYLNR